jgi:3D (Asp-Asp-Asp) domain-containing protein
MDIDASGSPLGGSFGISNTVQQGSNSSNAGVNFGEGSSSNSNPAALKLSDPSNPCAKAAPYPGGIEKIAVTYSISGNKAVASFQIPTFGMSCYYTALQSDWGSAPNNCKSTTINGVTYSGSTVNPPNLTGTYCNSFLAQVKLQGSAVLNSGQDIQYQKNGNYVPVNSILTTDGTPPIAGSTVARDKSIIPNKKVLIYLDQVGTDGLLANDTGGGINGYRLDLYMGVGKNSCTGFSNIMAVGYCDPQSAACTGFSVNQGGN